MARGASAPSWPLACCGGCIGRLQLFLSARHLVREEGRCHPAPARCGQPCRATDAPAAASDLAIARAAAIEVLTAGGKDASMPWENPHTGARGTITPLASAYNQDGLTCRDFLASYVKDGTESWLQGAACRVSAESGKCAICGRGTIPDELSAVRLRGSAAHCDCRLDLTPHIAARCRCIGRCCHPHLPACGRGDCRSMRSAALPGGINDARPL